MHTTTSLPTGQLKRFNIRIVTSGETAIQTTIARSSQQAWNIAFDLCERLLGDVPPRSISVKPAGVRSGFYLPAGQALQAGAVSRPVSGAGGWNAPVTEKVNPPLGVHLPVEADGFNLFARQGSRKNHTAIVTH